MWEMITKDSSSNALSFIQIQTALQYYLNICFNFNIIFILLYFFPLPFISTIPSSTFPLLTPPPRSHHNVVRVHEFFLFFSFYISPINCKLHDDIISERMKLKALEEGSFGIIKSTFDHWMWELGVPISHAVENPCITFDSPKSLPMTYFLPEALPVV